MENSITTHEITLIINPELDTKKADKVIENVKNVVRTFGIIESAESWGKRKLMYKMRGFGEGYYYQIMFHENSTEPLVGTNIDNLAHYIRNYPDIIKHIIVKKD